MGSDERRESIDDLDALLASLPPEIVAAVNALEDRTALIESIEEHAQAVANVASLRGVKIAVGLIALLERWGELGTDGRRIAVAAANYFVEME